MDEKKRIKKWKKRNMHLVQIFTLNKQTKQASDIQLHKNLCIPLWTWWKCFSKRPNILFSQQRKMLAVTCVTENDRSGDKIAWWWILCRIKIEIDQSRYKQQTGNHKKNTTRSEVCLKPKMLLEFRLASDSYWTWQTCKSVWALRSGLQKLLHLTNQP